MPPEKYFQNSTKRQMNDDDVYVEKCRQGEKKNVEISICSSNSSGVVILILAVEAILEVRELSTLFHALLDDHQCLIVNFYVDYNF